MRHLNVKLALCLVGITLALVVGVHLLHGYQLDRNADILRIQAEAAQKAGNTKEAVKQYSQYLKYRDDPAGYSALAALVVTTAKDAGATGRDKIQAYNTLEEAIRRHPDLVDVRRRLIEYTMLMHRWTETLEHIAYLAESGNKTPDLDLKMAQCHMGNGEESSSISKLYEIVGFDEKTEQFKPDPPGAKEVEAFELLAQVLRRKTGNLDRADAVMAQLVALNPDSAQAHLARASYLAATERPQDAKAEFDRAFELGPDDIEVLVAVASQATSGHDYETAQKLLDKAAEKNPERQDVYVRLAQLAYATGNARLATEHLEHGILRASDTQNIFPMLLEFQFQGGDLGAAQTTFRQMQDRGTYPPEFMRFANARIQFSEGNFWDASREFEAVRPAMSRSVYANYLQQLDLLLGRCYETLGMHDRQLEVSRRVLQSSPGQVGARLSEAAALQNLGRHDESAIDVQLLVANVQSFPSMAPDVLQLLISSTMRKPPEQRDWTDVEKIAAMIYADPARKPLDNELLKADLLMLQDRREEAQSVLAAARKQYPKELAVWLALIRFFQRDDKPDSVDKIGKVLTLAEKELGPVLPLRLERIRLVMRQGGDQMVKELAKLEQDGETLDAPQRVALTSQLGLG
jgi:tetratricopeptide (TPR) repeat protein